MGGVEGITADRGDGGDGEGGGKVISGERRSREDDGEGGGEVISGDIGEDGAAFLSFLFLFKFFIFL